MKFTKIVASIALLAVGVSGLAPERQVLITYPNDTPNAALDHARSSIEAIGGEILHEFKLIKGFLVKTTHTVLALKSLSGLSEKYKPTIEDDGKVYATDA